ncbi:MAG: bifunctional DNA-formamidopyrimidine glycosylase/DNA-(apurinic or apyrimidinic site) lyase [Chloroflexi bacterium]|nr:bifunctional DNA-formamidopyrimidine glycosylase/DNA-(apurinic or apyrimidinic site) lyase [Chloroflexota bacterium]
MPELPEVETVRRSLQPFLIGHRIVEVTRIAWPSTIAEPSPEEFSARLRDREIVAIDRRAKYLIIHLDQDEALVVHLRMTGQLTVVEAEAEPDKHTHVVLRLDTGQQMFYRDTRKFGRMWLLDREGLAALDRKLGPEPLDDTLTAEAFRALIRRRKGRLKQLLLDQAVIAGLGNIYVDEALWLAQLHPLATVGMISDEQIDALYAAIREVLASGIDKRGTTFSNYRDALGAKGSNQNYLNVYNRANQPCLRCGSPIEKIVVVQRGTHICAYCQPLGSSQEGES